MSGHNHADPVARRWKEFDSRWSRAGRMEKFIIVSIVLHIIIGVCWGLPKYFAWKTKEEILETKAKKEETRIEKAKDELEEVEEEIKEEENKELAETQLKELFEELTENFALNEELKEEWWKEIQEEMEEDVADLGDYIESENFDELVADEKVTELKEDMVNKLYDKVSEDLHENWKERYVQHLKKVTDKLAQKFRQELAKRIGQPLSKESEHMMQKEVRDIKKNLSDAKRELDQVKRSARDVSKNLEAAHKRVSDTRKQIDKERKSQEALTTEVSKEKGTEKPDKNKISKLTNDLNASKNRERNHTQNLKNQSSHVASQAQKLEGMKKNLDRAAKHLKDVAPEASAETDSIKQEDATNATHETRAEAGHLKNANGEKAQAVGKQAEKTVKEIQKKTDKVYSKVSKIRAENVVADRFRKVLAELEEKELKKLFKKAFEKEYKENALPQLKESLNKAFQEEAVRRGLVPPPISIEEELSKILGIDLPKKTKAGETSTKEMNKKNRLDQVEGKPGKGDLEKKTAEGIRKKAKYLADTQMKNVVASAVGDKRSWLLQNELELDAEGKEGVELLDKLGNMKNRMEQGRREFLGKGNKASLLSSRQRRRKLSRMRNSIRARNFRKFDKETFLAMIEKMKNREGTGDSFSLKGESGSVSKADDKDELVPAFMLAGEEKKPEKEKEKEKKERKVNPPDFKYNKFVGIPYLNKPITLDGDLKEWKEMKIPAITMTRVIKGGYKAKVYQDQTCWFAYDANGIYIAIDVKDTTGEIEDHKPLSLFWRNDCIEVWIDAMNTKYSRRGEAHTHQFFIYPFGHRSDRNVGGYEAYIGSKKTGIKYPRHGKDVLKRGAKKTKLGWALECYIPKSIVRKGNLRPGHIIGFNISCCTGSDTYYYWSRVSKLQTSSSPHSWGDIQLLGSDAALAIMDKEGKKERKTIVPGEILTVRVSDGDMNISQEGKDKVRVTVSAASGGYEPVICEETGPDTGVFIGSIATRPNIGAMKPSVLELFDGEKIEITYIDQAQAYGERDVRVVKEVNVTSAGASFAKE